MLKTKFLGTQLDNPFVLASGILGTTPEILKRVHEAGAGLVTIKSIGPCERFGNPNPTVYPWEHGLINAVGLPNAGIDNMNDELAALSKAQFPWVCSIYGSSIEDYSLISKAVSKYKPNMIELNISCPNKADGTIFATDPVLSKKLVQKVRKTTSIPLIAKLTPNTSDIISVAKACESAGADAINAINTVLGMVIDTEAKKPVLGYKTGGLSGPAIKPIAVRAVYQIYDSVKIPIIGTGGVSNTNDAVEMMMAGATVVGVGTGVYYRGEKIFRELSTGMEEWLKAHNYSDVSEIVGIAHR